jgi:hypothetical protein
VFSQEHQSKEEHSLVQLSHAHAPGPRGSPQLPQGPGAASKEVLSLFALTAKVDSSLLSFVLLQDGQIGVVEPMMRASN